MENTNSTESSDSTMDFKSGELFLSIAKDEYFNELNRNSIIDTKANIALPIIAAYFFLLAQMIDLHKLLTLETISMREIVLSLLLITLYVIAIFLSFISFNFLIKSIQVQDYTIINVDDFYKTEYLVLQVSDFASSICTFYIKATKMNKLINDKRTSLYKKSLKFSELSLISFVVYIFILNILRG
ncbi:hypothetical protein [Lacrimispora amygdalina]|uniref:hypothetical protein n=1 Tax=Lacrimispora amygdalina TaxID=253257 RepID=UPI000BE3E37F|nr:hypothetical protein [Lacrimispora amygdalina]